jgi:uncharacterized damage-inducible protein DinB
VVCGLPALFFHQGGEDTIMTDTERKEKITKIRELPSQVEQAIKGLRDEQFDTPYRDNGWTVRQVIHHLADSHMNAFVRTKLMMTEKNPNLKTYEQEEWARTPDAQKVPVESSVMILKGLHERWIRLLESRGPEDWKKTAMHPENGLMTLDDILTVYARHGETHVSQITGLREARGW